MTKKKRLKTIKEIEQLFGLYRYEIYALSNKELRKELKLRKGIKNGKYIKPPKF
jgi:hypothetical protein